MHAESQQVLDEPVGEKGSGQYVWTTQWYPVRVAEDLHTDRPNALKLLGKDLVIWRDAQSQWRCFEDACPHRYANVVASHSAPAAVTDHLPMIFCLISCRQRHAVGGSAIYCYMLPFTQASQCATGTITAGLCLHQFGFKSKSRLADCL